MEFIGSTGKKIVINPGAFEDVWELKSAIQSKLKLANLESLKGSDMKNVNIAPFLEILMALDSSKRVNKALMKCLHRCTYNLEKITEKTFENEEAREDYYEIIFACIKVNLAPFLKGLISKLNGAGSTITKGILPL